jgi:hypothetical protein
MKEATENEKKKYESKKNLNILCVALILIYSYILIGHLYDYYMLYLSYKDIVRFINIVWGAFIICFSFYAAFHFWQHNKTPGQPMPLRFLAEKKPETANRIRVKSINTIKLFLILSCLYPLLMNIYLVNFASFASYSTVQIAIYTGNFITNFIISIIIYAFLYLYRKQINRDKKL